MSYPGELLRDNILPPPLGMRVLVSTGRSALRLAFNYHQRDEFGKMVGLRSLNEEHKRACNQLALRLQGSPLEDTEFIGSGSRLTSFERRVAELLDLEEPAGVKDTIFRTTGVLDTLGVSGKFDDVDQKALHDGITALDAMSRSLVEMYPSELPPRVRSA